MVDSTHNGGPPIWLPASIFTNSVVGIRNREFTHLEAWIHLASLDATSPINLATTWRWSPRKARMLIVQAVSEDHIDESVGSYLLEHLRQKKPNRLALPKSTRATVWAKTGGKCVYCCQVLTMRRGQPNSYHADHVLSVRNGGSDDVANLIPSCATCNARKAAKPFLAFIEEIGGQDD